jgi:signal transduction histidine kinase
VRGMATSVASPIAPPRRRRPMPWSPRSWGQALYLAGAAPALLLGMSVPAIRVLLAGRWSVLWHGFAGPYLWLPWLLIVFLLVPVLTQIQRHRLRTAAGIDILPQPRIADRLTVQGLMRAARSQATWRQMGYHLIAAPALALAAMAAVGTWLGSLLLALVYLWGWELPPGALFRQATYPDGGVIGARVDAIGQSGWPMGVFLTLAGIAGLFVAPWLVDGVGVLDERAARTLLGPSRAEELEHQVQHLTQTRAGVVDAADAERRRLERDLHDGTQQRLVSLAISLGMARVNATTAEEAQQALTQAHEEAKAALSELRDLIRGLHPAVLEDRGLDAALSGVAARMPIPVRLSVDLPRRPAPVIEAVAYFVVSEGLANIAKHAQASQAEVVVQRAGDRLHIIVSDDGVGGASPARGTGLAGLASRARSVDGDFDVFSPPGGPTLLSVDLPCSR